MNSTSSFGTFRLLLAAGLILWFAGAGCVFVTFAHGTMAASGDAAGQPACHLLPSPASVSEEVANVADLGQASDADDTIVVASGHACCKLQLASGPSESSSLAQGKSIFPVELLPASLASLPPPSGAMSCCPLMSAAAAVVTRPGGNETTAAPVEQTTLPALTTRASTSSLSTPLRLPNRGHTYLRCCTFLI